MSLKSTIRTLIAVMSIVCWTLPVFGQPNQATSAGTGAQKGTPMVFTTLGTMSGPITNPTRSQPAYVLHNNQQKILIDTGDGAAGQLAKVNIPLDEVQTIILSHHHIDHIGGLFAILGMRQQTNIYTDLTIYGPIGAKKLVDELIASLQALQDFLSEITKTQKKTAFNTVKVVEVTDGSKFTVGSVSVTAVTNTHYPFPPGSADAARFQSLSYRFDLPDRSIVFTGDTAPCKKVEELARNVDLLVSEIMDVDEAIEKIKLKYPNAPANQYAIVKKHFLDEHLTADEVGKLAKLTGAKKLVLTHNGGSSQSNDRSRVIITSYFKGPITFAKDLENY